VEAVWRRMGSERCQAFHSYNVPNRHSLYARPRCSVGKLLIPKVHQHASGELAQEAARISLPSGIEGTSRSGDCRFMCCTPQTRLPCRRKTA